MVNLKKFILSYILIPIATTVIFAKITDAETIRTKSFQIEITRHCEEGSVSCDRVVYVGKELKTGKSIFLTGKTLNNIHSYTFLGYEFRNGKYRYVISRNNSLLVYKGDKLILQEEGKMIDN